MARGTPRMVPWYRNVSLRPEVREGRSFSPDEFAIALEQVVAGTAPEDYRDPKQFFARTCFTRALKDHAGMVLRRLAGETGDTAPVVTLVTQFGGGKTHTLTSLYHLANSGSSGGSFPGVAELLKDARLADVPNARVGVFVGNAWDPAEGRETPWIDLARQLGGERAVAALGSAARETPPGTDALGEVFAAVDAPVLLLFDEVLNFVNRHRAMADRLHAFLQNLTVAVSGRRHAAAVVSLPRSQVEMTDWDRVWQERITKVVRRVARDLIANDEAEISEVVRRRLFADLGNERARGTVARSYAEWCFERTARLPSEWLAVDSASTTVKAKEYLRERFDACYPFHPATLSVFQRKWRALAQFQQTRGALAMLAQWVSSAAREQFHRARTEPLITLGSAPLDNPEFRAVVLGQLGESRLDAAIDADLAGRMAHARALDTDATGALRDIHRRTGTAILFESSGGQVDKIAHLPELRFALGEPDIETTTVDNAAAALADSGFFVRKVGTDGYRIHHQATLRKVVSDRRASLDPDADVKPAARRLVEAEFKRGVASGGVPTVFFPDDSSAIPDSPRLAIVILDPEEEWSGTGPLGERIRSWTVERGAVGRLYPASLVWCIKKPGKELLDRVEIWLAWQAVARELSEGVLGAGYDQSERTRIRSQVQEAQDAARDEVWAGYRHLALFEHDAKDGLRVLDIGAGHASASDSLAGRIVSVLKTEALLNEGVGAGYLGRNWPPAFEESGAWPLSSLRQSFLNGTLTRLVDPDAVLRERIAGFVAKGEFGLASGAQTQGRFDRIWYNEVLDRAEVAFEDDVFLIARAKAQELTAAETEDEKADPREKDDDADDEGLTIRDGEGEEAPAQATIRVTGSVPPEAWNRLGTRLLPKLRSGDRLDTRVDFLMDVKADRVGSLVAEIQQILDDLGIGERLRVQRD